MADDWQTLAQQYGLSQTDIQNFAAQGQTPQSVSGQLGGTGGAYSGVWNAMAQQYGLSSSDIAAFQAQGMTEADAADRLATYFAPESVGLRQMQQIDPATEALRQQLAGSYMGTLAQGAGPPKAADVQSYLNLYGQIDPTGLAARQQLGSALAQQSALGTQIDPAMAREIDQATREAQVARGNVYGTPQLLQEAMTRGQAGLTLQQQRQQALQGFLSSGQDVGSVAQGLYQQGLSNLRSAQGATLGYLGSGQTPYQAGASYLNTAEQRAASAAQGGPSYNPQGPSPYYTGAGASSFPQYGLDMSQLANQWGQSMNYANLMAAQMGGQKGGGGGQAASGALSGAASGALTGAAGGPWGALIGAGVGALGGAAKGYFS